MKIKKAKIFRIILVVIVLAIIIGMIIYLFPLFQNLSTDEGKQEFKEKIQSSGFLGLLMIFGLQFAQIFLIIIPGEPLEVLAGMCYGTIGGTIFITVSAFIISSLIFFAVRKFGRKFVYSFCSKESVEKIENSKLFKNVDKLEWIMIILFLIPGTPKDLLVYIAGLLPIKPLRFILISTFARFPSVISSTIAGANIIEGKFHMIFVSYLVTFLIVAIFIFVINKFDKTKLTKEALNKFKNENKTQKKMEKI